MNSEYDKYLYEEELKATFEINSRIERLNKIVEFIENQGGRVAANILDYHFVNRQYDFEDQIKCDLWYDDTNIKIFEQIIEEYKNERVG